VSRVHRALLIAVAIGGASCIGREAAPTGERRAEVVGGAPDTLHASVVALVEKSGSVTSVCSGTLVAPTLVVTAAHCVFGREAAAFSVVVGDDLSAPAEQVDVARTFPYPTFAGKAEGIPGGVDLAVVELAAPLAIAPLEIFFDTTDEQLEGADVTVVGYGASDGSDESGVGLRRAVELHVLGICNRVIEAGNLEKNACAGDSGGAVLLGGRLVAVVSGGKQGCFSPTSFTRIDAYAVWLSAVLAGNPPDPCEACVSPDEACGAPVEPRPAGIDAAVDGSLLPVAARPEIEGGCALAIPRGVPGSGWVIALAAAAARRRRRRRSGQDA
jgi:hypothetical protein